MSQTSPSSTPSAELSSIASALEDLTSRITHLADDLTREGKEEISSQLYEVERSLLAGQRRLTKLVR